jgi:hypothetical protein
MMAQMSKPSTNEEDNLSHVTAPPIRIPGIHDGKGRMGNLNNSVPGIGTPMAIPTKVLTAKIQADNLSVHSKLLAHGTSSRNV